MWYIAYVIDIETLPEFDGHEAVFRFSDQDTGLRGFIAIHNTNAGPAVGGTRFCHYANEEGALRDALRLSRAMTYKCALAGVPYGGGKAVLMAPAGAKAAKKLKTKKYLESYARRLALLSGSFFTGEDVGMTGKDIEILDQCSAGIIGRPSVGGLPSYWAALSVFESMRAALKEVFGSDSFKGRTVAIKGLGNVGSDLAAMLDEAGASVIGAEVDSTRAREAKKRVPDMRLVSSASIHTQKVDIFSPCALSGDLSKTTIPKLKAKIVCGSANNQLATSQDGERLFKRSIVYVPDYVANAGGLISVVDELHEGGYSRARVARNVARVRATVADILRQSKKKRHSPDSIADKIGKERFSRPRRKK